MNKAHQKKITTALELLTQDSTTTVKCKKIASLLKGIDPELDKAITQFTKHLSNYEKLHKGDVIHLSADNLPENEIVTDEQFIMFSYDINGEEVVDPDPGGCGFGRFDEVQVKTISVPSTE